MCSDMSEQMFFWNHKHATLYCQKKCLTIHLIIACVYRFYHVLILFCLPGKRHARKGSKQCFIHPFIRHSFEFAFQVSEWRVHFASVPFSQGNEQERRLSFEFWECHSSFDSAMPFNGDRHNRFLCPWCMPMRHRETDVEAKVVCLVCNLNEVHSATLLKVK